MSQIVLDDQLFPLDVLVPIARWATVQRLRDVRPGEVIKDERVPVILRDLRQPTFVTIDMGFWTRRMCDGRYCMVCFPLRRVLKHRTRTNPHHPPNLRSIPTHHSHSVWVDYASRYTVLPL